MSTPGAFQQGEDFVALRLSMAVDDTGVTGLRTLVQEVDRLRVSTEAASRSEDSFVRYLESMATAADRAAAATRNLSVAQQGPGGSGQLNAPGQYVSPFAGLTAGMGMGRVPATIPEAQDMLEQLRNVNPRAYINKMGASGYLRTGDVPASTPSDEDLAQIAQRVSTRELAFSGQGGQLQGIAGTVLNEFSQGGSTSALRGVSSSTAQGLGPAEAGFLNAAQRWAAHGRIAGGGGGGGLLESLGLGRLAGGLGGGEAGAAAGMGGLGSAGAAAAAMGIPLALLGAFEKGGNVVQGWRSMGEIRGGGAGQGIGYEAQIRAMALNPFITTEQSRQIIQQGLREGYTGKTFDTVTQFVSRNLQDMNIDISTSFEMMRKNVAEGGESVTALNTNLRTMSDLSKAGAQSLPTMIAGFQGTSTAAINAGMGGPAAAQYAMAGTAAFPNNPALSPTANQMLGAMMQPGNQAWMLTQGGMNLPQGLLPGALQIYAGQNPQNGQVMAQGASNVLKQWALRYYNQYGRPAKGTVAYANAVSLWSMFLQHMQIPWANNEAVVMQWFDAYVSDQDPVTGSMGRVNQQQKTESQVQERGFNQRYGGGMGAAGGAAVRDVGGFFHMIGSDVASFFSGHGGQVGEHWDEFTHRVGGGAADVASAEGHYTIPILEEVQKRLGPKGYEVLDQSGKPIKLDQNNRSQMQKLASDEYRIRAAGTSGAGLPLSQIPTASNSGDLRNALGGGASTNVSGQITIGLTPEARQLITAPQTARLTPHEQAANQGATDTNGNVAAPNNAPPGYTLPRQYGSGSW